MREDLIENEAATCIDETSIDEKTWSWWVFTEFYLMSSRVRSEY